MGNPKTPLPTSRSLELVIHYTVPLLLGLALCGCRTSVPRYIATVTPLNLLGTGHPGICIAIDPADAHSAWWWEPGPAGCASRTTGPAVFRAAATVAAPGNSTDIEVRFQLPMKVGVRDVRLLLRDGRMHETPSGAQASTARRGDLDIPSACGR